MRSFFYYFPLFVFGGAIYSGIEIAFRGYTHITMFFAGGLCLAFIALADRLRIPFWSKLFVGGMIITAVEFVFGVIFNIIFKMGVWDYSTQMGNIMGQICPKYTVCWIVITLPAILITRLWRKLLGETENALQDEPKSVS